MPDTTPDVTQCIDVTAILRSLEWVAPADFSPDYCPLCDREREEGHAPDCAIAAAINADPTAEIARLRGEVEQAHAALDRSGVDTSRHPLVSRIRLLDAAGRLTREAHADRRAMREAHAEALADVERLTRERDAALADAARLREVLRACLPTVRSAALSEEDVYGSFPGGDMDPRDFYPDPECSTEDERAAHAATCARWEAGDRTPMPSACIVTSRRHLTTQRFGLGVMVWRDHKAIRAYKMAEAAAGDELAIGPAKEGA